MSDHTNDEVPAAPEVIAPVVPEAPAEAPAAVTPEPAASPTAFLPAPPDEGPAPFVPVASPSATPGRPRFPVMLGVTLAVACILVATVVGGVAGVAASRWYSQAGHITTSVLTSTDEPVAAAAAVALPSVVNIDVTGSTSASGLPGGHPDVPTGGTGSGVAYKSTSDGGTYIVTNDHVVADAKSIVVTPADGSHYDATLVGTDPETDIAVVRISQPVPLISVGDSEKLVVGQMVIAIGSPFGLQHSVSSGVVSALHLSITTLGSVDATGSVYPLVDAIQTDAAINPGNSGGALVDR